MPWWAYSYLAIYLAFTVFAMYDNSRLPNKLINISADIICATFVIFFVSAYFNQSVYSFVGSSILILVGIGILIEIISSLRDLRDIKKDPDLSDSEHQLIVVFFASLAVLIVIPGYLFGLLAFIKYK